LSPPIPIPILSSSRRESVTFPVRDSADCALFHKSSVTACESRAGSLNFIGVAAGAAGRAIAINGAAVFKSFVIGILSGVLLLACLLYFVPVVDQHREASLISVQANGGNTESFHANLPDDRILIGGAGKEVSPANLQWPEVAVLGDAQAELFKIRNRNDVVVG